jgi:SSS family solute:Na+ symporter
MLTRDVLPQRVGERRPVLLGRVFLVALAALTWWIVIRQPASIFKLAGLSFSGYVTLVPTLLLGLRWRRFTVMGATASIVLGNAVMLLCFAGVIPTLGLLPVAWGLAAAILGAVVGSLVSAASPAAAVEAVHGPIERALSADARVNSRDWA